MIKPSFIFILLLLFVSCVKEVKLSIPAENLVVINGLFIENQQLSIRVAQAVLPNEHISNHYKWIENAEVELWRDGQFLNEMPHISSTDSGLYMGGFITDGHTYKVNVLANGQNLSAEIALPSKISIDSLAHQKTQVIDEYGNLQDKWNYKLFFKDTPNVQNFYEVVMYRLNFSGEKEYIHYFSCENPIITSDNILLGDYGNQRKLLFSDFTFDGQNFQLDFSSSMGISDNPNLSNDIYIELRSVSESYYKYMTSVPRHIFGMPFIDENDPSQIFGLMFFAEPSSLYTNVKGGLGVIIAYTSNTYKIK